MRRTTCAMIAIGLSLTVTASAEPIYPDVMLTFDALPAAVDWPDASPLSDAVITDDFESFGLVFGRPGLSAGSLVYSEPGASPSNAHSGTNGLVGLDAGGAFIDPTSDQYFSIVDPLTGVPATTSFLRFVIGDGGGDLDSWMIHVYDLWDAELEARSVSSIAHTAQVFRLPTLHRVWIEWTGPTGGYFLDDIHLVPEPATAVLLALACGGLFCRSRFTGR